MRIIDLAVKKWFGVFCSFAPDLYNQHKHQDKYWNNQGQGRGGIVGQQICRHGGRGGQSCSGYQQQEEIEQSEPAARFEFEFEFEFAHRSGSLDIKF